MATDVNSYLTQWLQTATGGDVKYAVAFDVQRLKLWCARCNDKLTMSTEIACVDTTVDWELQEFVKKHSVAAHTAKQAAMLAQIQAQQNAQHNATFSLLKLGSTSVNSTKTLGQVGKVFEYDHMSVIKALDDAWVPDLVMPKKPKAPRIKERPPGRKFR